MTGVVLLTGASGYIGSRLLRVLEAGGFTVRCLAREPARVTVGRATTEVMAGDCLDEASLDAAMNAVDQAIYLVHSMASGGEFAALDREAAANFGRAAAVVDASPQQAFAPIRRIGGATGWYFGDPDDCLVGDVVDGWRVDAYEPDRLLRLSAVCRTVEGETEARGVARIVDERTFAKLKVRFAHAWLSWLPMVWGDWVIAVAPDYSRAVVGDPGRDYLWILARAPQRDGRSLTAARTAAQDNGFDVARLVPTPQTRAGR